MNRTFSGFSSFRTLRKTFTVMQNKLFSLISVEQSYVTLPSIRPDPDFLEPNPTWSPTVGSLNCKGWERSLRSSRPAINPEPCPHLLSPQLFSRLNTPSSHSCSSSGLCSRPFPSSVPFSGVTPAPPCPYEGPETEHRT